MSCNSALYVANSTTQAVAIGGTINFGSPVRRLGCACNVSAGNVTLSGIGYYNCIASIDFDGTAAGTATIALYKDGVAIPGAVATRTTAAGTSFAVSIPFMVRDTCCCKSTITAVVSGSAINVTNAAMTVEKL